MLPVTVVHERKCRRCCSCYSLHKPLCPPEWSWLQWGHSAQGTPFHLFSSSQKHWGSLSRGISGVCMVQSSTQISLDTRICLQASWLSLCFGGIVSPCTWGHHSPISFTNHPPPLWKSQQRSALCISWQTHTATGWTGLRMPGGSRGLVQACLRTASPREWMSQCPGQRGCALLGVHPAIHPPGTAWSHPLSSCPGQWRLWVGLVVLPWRNLRESRNYFVYSFFCPSICGTGDQAVGSESHQQPGWQDKGLSIKKTSSLTPVDPELHSSVLVWAIKDCAISLLLNEYWDAAWKWKGISFSAAQTKQGCFPLRGMVPKCWVSPLWSCSNALIFELKGEVGILWLVIARPLF